MNHAKRKIFQELNDPEWYCSTCMFKWGEDENTCPVCGSPRVKLTDSQKFTAFFRCNECKISILQLEIEVLDVDSIQPTIERTCPICKKKTIHELESAKAKKKQKYKSLSDIAEGEI